MNLTELVHRIVNETLRRLRVSMPAKVVSYDPGRSMVQVEIIQPELMPDGSVEDQPVISEVPVQFLRSGGAKITTPIKAGDTGLLFFCDRDIGQWVSSGNEGAPQSKRTHNISDAVFVPGVQGGGVSSDPDNLVLEHNGGKVVINDDGKIAIGKGEELLALLDEVIEATANGICVPGSYLSTKADLEAIKARLQTIKGSL